MSAGYVHGYSGREAERLHDQAGALSRLLHHDTSYPGGSEVLEVGCGVGAQTVTLCAGSPSARFTCVDIHQESLARAEAHVTAMGHSNARFVRADVFDLPFEPGAFDHAFCCFLLEHLADPAAALGCIRGVLADGGTLTVIEGDHGSAFFHPDSEYARLAVRCLIESQARLGGNALVGRELFPLLAGNGWKDVRVSPRVVYADSSRPDLVEGFTRNTFTAMVRGARDTAVEMGLASGEDLDRGIRDLYRTSEEDGTFCYTFFKAFARA